MAASIKNEIESIKAFIAPQLPGVKIDLEHRGPALAAKTAVIELEGLRESTTETAFHYRIDSTVQITYYDTSKLRCLQAMEKVVTHLMNEKVIPLNGSDRFIKFHAPTVTKAFETQTPGVFFIACMLRTYVREPFTRPEYKVINRIETALSDEN